MTEAVLASPIGTSADAWLLAADERGEPRWLRWAGPALSVAVLLTVARMLGGRDLIDAERMLPRTPGFWLALAGLLAAQPLADYAIFRGLWRLPVAGLAALFRKVAINELVLSYTGELQFYLWARRHADLPGSPFGAVRDVAVLSALAGNVLAVVLLVLALPIAGGTPLAPLGDHLIASGLAIVLSSLAITLLRRRLFAVTPAQLARIGAIHLARAIIVTLLFALLWHLVDPAMGLGGCAMLAAARQLVTRLPFLPTKDLVLAGLAADLLRQAPHVAATVALVAALYALGQLLIGGTLAAADLIASAAQDRSGS